MKKQTRKKLIAYVSLAAAVILIVEFNKFMKRQELACVDGSCSTQAQKVFEAQQLPLPEGATPITRPALLPSLIDFGAGKCVNCKLMNKVLEELRTEVGQKISIQFVDVWKDEEAGKKHSIKLIPTQIFLDAEGNELFRHEGFISKEDILKKWTELGINLSNE